jgi:hypothetical protein
MKKILVASMLALTTLGMGAPAHAAILPDPGPIHSTGPVVIVAQATLKTFPGTGTLAVVNPYTNANDTLIVTVAGVEAEGEVASAETANGGAVTYNEPAGQPLIGTANGNLTFADGDSYAVTYSRIGLVATFVARSTTLPEMEPDGSTVAVDFIIATLAVVPNPVQVVNGGNPGAPHVQDLTFTGPGQAVEGFPVFPPLLPPAGWGAELGRCDITIMWPSAAPASGPTCVGTATGKAVGSFADHQPYFFEATEAPFQATINYVDDCSSTAGVPTIGSLSGRLTFSGILFPFGQAADLVGDYSAARSGFNAVVDYTNIGFDVDGDGNRDHIPLVDRGVQWRRPRSQHSP